MKVPFSQAVRLHFFAPRTILLIAVLTGIAIFFQYFLSRYTVDEFSSEDVIFNNPQIAVPDSNGNLLVIDSTAKRVLRSNSNGELVFALHGGSRIAENFFYAFDVAGSPDGKTYVLNSVPDHRGAFHVREEIQEYSPEGRYIRTLYTLHHQEAESDQAMLRHGRIRSLQYQNDTLVFFECSPAGITSKTINLSEDTPEIYSRFYPYPGADWDCFAVTSDQQNTIYLTDKKGDLVMLSANGTTKKVLFSSAANTYPGSSSLHPAPWDVGIDNSGNLFFTEIINSRILRRDPNGVFSVSLDSALLQQKGHHYPNANYYRLGVSDNGLIASCNESAVILYDAKNGEILFADTTFSTAGEATLLHWLLRALFRLTVLFVVYLFFASYILLIGVKVQRLVAIFSSLLLFMGLAAYVSTTLLVDNFSERNDRQTLTHLRQLVKAVSAAITPEYLNELRQVEDYRSPSYMALRNQLDHLFDIHDPTDTSSFYFVLYKLSGDRLYAMMWQDTTIGTFHPTNYNLPDYPDQSYRNALNGEIVTSLVEDYTGNWLIGIGPIHNPDGSIAGLLEIGTDSFVFRETNKGLLQNVVLEIGTLLIFIALFLLEVLYYFEFKKRNRELTCPEDTILLENDFSPVYFVRTLNFLYFTATSMSLCFIPIMMKDFYFPVPFLSETVILALPVSANMLFFGFGNLMAGSYSGLKNARKLIYSGLFISAAGFLASGYANGMTVFTIARAVSGLGSGFAFIGIRSIILLEQRPLQRDTAYAHFYAGMTAGINVGLILGAILADKLGYCRVFEFSTLLLLGTMILDFASLKNIFNTLLPTTPLSSGDAPRHPLRETCSKLRDFLREPQALAFIFCDIIPCYTIAAFIVYFFPLYAEECGFSTGDTGRFMLASGLLTILFGPTLTAQLTRKLGTRKGMYFAFTMWAASILVFACTGSFAGAAATLLLMGLLDGFATPFCNNYFLSLPAAHRAGEERAIACYELTGKIGDTLGPILFAFAISFGDTKGIAVISIATLCCVLLLFVIESFCNRRHKSDEVAG